MKQSRKTGAKKKKKKEEKEHWIQETNLIWNMNKNFALSDNKSEG